MNYNAKNMEESCTDGHHDMSLETIHVIADTLSNSVCLTMRMLLDRFLQYHTIIQPGGGVHKRENGMMWRGMHFADLSAWNYSMPPHENTWNSCFLIELMDP